MRWWNELKYLMRKLNRRRAEREAEEARHAAQRAFGSVALAKEGSREVWGWRTLEIIGQDLRYGLRTMQKKPGFTLIAIGMLAVAIAANTSIFSIVDALILRPFRLPNQERLVMIWSQSLKAGYEHKYILNGVFADWQKQSRSFEQLIHYSEGFFELTGTSQPEQVFGYNVSANFFEALGVQAALGRTMQWGEDEPGRDQVVVLRHSFWQRRFGSDPEIVGKTLTLNRRAYTVIGVMPANFNFTPHDIQFCVPHVLDEKTKHSYEHGLAAMGLLKPGVGIEQARAELDAIWQRAPQRYLEMNSWPTPQVIGMNEDFGRDKQMFLWPLVGTVALMLLIVCANVANMLLGRALGRQKEIAVRLALGAPARSIIRLILGQGLKLTLAGIAIGMAGALALTGIMQQLLYGISATDPLTFMLVLLTMAGAALLACWLPARRATRVDPMVALRCD